MAPDDDGYGPRGQSYADYDKDATPPAGRWCAEGVSVVRKLTSDRIDDPEQPKEPDDRA
jgi:hypothetical protein